MSIEVKHRSGHKSENGKYLFTIDSYHSDRDIPDLTFAEFAEEHKSHNCIILPNGQINFIQTIDVDGLSESLTPPVLKKPDFLVSTRSFSVENGGLHLIWVIRTSEEYFWEHENKKK